MKARVVVLKEYRKPFVIEEYDVPEPAPDASAPADGSGGHLRLRSPLLAW